MTVYRRSSLCLISLVVPALVLFGACAAPPPPAVPPAPPPAAPTPPAPPAESASAAPPEAATSPAAPPPAEAVASASAAATAPPPPAEPAQASEPPKPAAAVEKSGEAVYYSSNGSGACSLTFGRDAAVLSAPNVVYNKIEACGQCLEISGPVGTAVVQVVDRCNTCADNVLVINKPAFDLIAGKASHGREQIKWKPVPCSVQGGLEFRIKKTSSEYWTAIQVRNHRLPIKSVAFKRGSDWVEMTRSDDNYFVAQKGVGKGALSLRIVANDGQAVEHTWDKWKDGETYKGSAQFK
jgi:expansin (peptidoglycan-binding protein)